LRRQHAGQKQQKQRRQIPHHFNLIFVKI
jgi:hypothetical protein